MSIYVCKYACLDVRLNEQGWREKEKDREGERERESERARERQDRVFRKEQLFNASVTVQGLERSFNLDCYGLFLFQYLLAGFWYPTLNIQQLRF